MSDAEEFWEVILWEYEDELPELTDDQYSRMVELSVVDGTRLFPYILREGKRLYLGAEDVSA